ncbi:MAG: hypothetical protein ACI8WT_004604 [Clostridium sp.]|jgi:hypothetical protein
MVSSDYAIRRFQEVDEGCANRIKNAATGYRREQIGLTLMNVGVFSNSLIGDMDDYNKILGHAGIGNKQAVANLSSDQIKELTLQLEPDEGFWAPIVNNQVTNQYIRKAFNDPNLGERYTNFLKSNTIASSFHSAIGSVDEEGIQIQPKAGGNGILNGIAGLTGDIALFAFIGSGSPGGLGFGNTEKVINESLLKSNGLGIRGLSKAAQITTKLGSSGAEMGYFNGVNTIVQGGTFKDVAKSTGEGFILGAGVRGFGIGAKYGISKIIEKAVVNKPQAIMDVFNQRVGEIKVTKEPIKVIKPVESTIIPEIINKVPVNPLEPINI